MSAAQTIPMFSPDGSLGDVPIEQAQAARTAGAVPAVNILDPQGNPGHVPANRVQEAVQAGAKVVPFGQQEVAAHPGILATIGSDLKGMFTNIPQVTSPYPGMDLERKQQVAQQAVAEDQARQKAGYGPLYRAAAPIAEAAGTNVPGMEQAAAEGNARGVIGHAAAGAGVAAAPLAAEGVMRGAKAAGEAVSGSVDTTRSARVAMPAETAELPDPAVKGAEKVFQAAAPTGTNTRFRANVYAAAGDLAEIGRDVNTKLQDAKGGIVQPDMRARVTVDAINQHLQEMYNTERAPQIANHSDAPVPVPQNESITAGITQMVRSGDPAVAKLAAKARAGTITLAEADELARGVNAELRKYESMTPEAQAAARVNSRALGGLKALDRELTESIDDQLRIDGQPGIREYERRYAALSSIRDQLRVRTNTAELQHPGPVKAAARAVHNVVSGMSGNIAGASQAAVADVRMGRALQQGLQQLADSGIKANRAVPRSPAPLDLTSPPGRVPPATQDLLNFNGADQELGPKAGGGNGGTPKVPNSTADVQSRSGNAAGAAQENGILVQVQKEHPDWSVSQQLMEAGKRSERRAGPRNGHVFTEEERQKFLDREREVEAARHPNKWLKENPFDKDPLARELAKRETERMLQGGEDILSGRP